MISPSFEKCQQKSSEYGSTLFATTGTWNWTTRIRHERNSMRPSVCRWRGVCEWCAVDNTTTPFGYKCASSFCFQCRLPTSCDRGRFLFLHVRTSFVARNARVSDARLTCPTSCCYVRGLTAPRPISSVHGSRTPPPRIKRRNSQPTRGASHRPTRVDFARLCALFFVEIRCNLHRGDITWW